jgi:hypothetical protein
MYKAADDVGVDVVVVIVSGARLTRPRRRTVAVVGSVAANATIGQEEPTTIQDMDIPHSCFKTSRRSVVSVGTMVVDGDDDDDDDDNDDDDPTRPSAPGRGRRTTVAKDELVVARQPTKSSPSSRARFDDEGLYISPSTPFTVNFRSPHKNKPMHER